MSTATRNSGVWWASIFFGGLAAWAMVGFVANREALLDHAWWFWWGVFGFSYATQNSRLEQIDEGLRSRILFGVQVFASLAVTWISAHARAPQPVGQPLPNLFVTGPFLCFVTAARAATFLGLPGGFVLIFGQTFWIIGAMLSAGYDLLEVGQIGMPFGLVTLQGIVFAYGSLAQHQRVLRIGLAEMVASLQVSQALLALSQRREQRAEILRDLHDSAGHSLTALGLLLETAIQAEEDERLKALRRAEKIRRELVLEIRGLVHEELRNLASAIEHLVAITQAAYARGSVTADIRLPPGEFDPMVADVLYRATQEGLTNAVRHSGAASIHIDLEHSNGRFVLAIEDDGAEDAMESVGGEDHVGEKLAGYGLRGLRARIEKIGGTFETRRLQPRGFSVVIEIPEGGEIT